MNHPPTSFFSAMETVYHYTSNSNAASILREKKIRQSKSGAYGPGTYVTPYCPTDKRHKGVSARSTECVFQFDVSESSLWKHDYGKWRILTDIDMSQTYWILLETETLNVKESSNYYYRILYIAKHYTYQLIKYLSFFMIVPMAFFLLYGIHCTFVYLYGHSEIFVFGPGKYDFSTEQFVTSDLFPFENVEMRTVWPGEAIEIEPTFEVDGMLTGSTPDGLVPLYELSSHEPIASLANIEETGRMVKRMCFDEFFETYGFVRSSILDVEGECPEAKYIEMDDEACYCFVDSSLVNPKSHILISRTMFSIVMDFLVYIIENGCILLIDMVAIPMILAVLVLPKNMHFSVYWCFLVAYLAQGVYFQKSVGSPIIYGLFWTISNLWSVLMYVPSLLWTTGITDITLSLAKYIPMYGFAAVMYNYTRNNRVLLLAAYFSFPAFLDVMENKCVYFNHASESLIYTSGLFILYMVPLWIYVIFFHWDKMKTAYDFILLPFNHSLRPSQIYWYAAINRFSYEVDLKNKIQRNCSTLKTRNIMKNSQGNWAYIDETWHEYPPHIQTALKSMEKRDSHINFFMYCMEHIFYGCFLCQQLWRDFGPMIQLLPGAGRYLLHAARNSHHWSLQIISSFVGGLFDVAGAIWCAVQIVLHPTFIKYVFLVIMVASLFVNALVLFLVVKEALPDDFLKDVENICENFADAVFGDIVFVLRTRRKFLRLLRPSM